MNISVLERGQFGNHEKFCATRSLREAFSASIILKSVRLCFQEIFSLKWRYVTTFVENLFLLNISEGDFVEAVEQWK